MGNQVCLDYYNSSVGIHGKICAKYEETDTLITIASEAVSNPMTLHNVMDGSNLQNTSGSDWVRAKSHIQDKRYVLKLS